MLGARASLAKRLCIAFSLLCKPSSWSCDVVGAIVVAVVVVVCIVDVACVLGAAACFALGLSLGVAELTMNLANKLSNVSPRSFRLGSEGIVVLTAVVVELR